VLVLLSTLSKRLKKRKNSRLLVRKKRMKKILSNIGLLLGVTGKVELNHQ
jgi:hypothetical protein